MANPRPEHHNEVTIEFQESQHLLDSREFAHFLYLFRAAYIRCLDLPVSQQSEAFIRDTVLATFYRQVRPVRSAQIANLFNTDAGNDELKIAKINKSSPLIITFIGVIWVLTAAVILSGGKVDLKLMKFTVPPIGVGIKHLRDAFRLPPIKLKKRKKRRLQG